MKYIIDKNNNISKNFSDEIDKVLKNKLPSNTQVKARDYTPKILVENGVEDLPMLITQKHIKSIIYTNEQAKSLNLPIGKKEHYHGLGKDILIKVINSLDKPLEIYKQSDKRYLIITEIIDNKNNKIVVPIQINAKGIYNNVFIKENQITTVYGHEYLKEYLNYNNYERIYIK